MQRFLRLLEKNRALSWTLTIATGIFIYYVSSLEFGTGTGDSSSINSLLYHLIIFFVFAFFLTSSLNFRRSSVRIFLGLFIAIIYGYLDEVHQIFVPNRSYSYFDMLLDAVGSILAISVYAISAYSRR